MNQSLTQEFERSEIIRQFNLWQTIALISSVLLAGTAISFYVAGRCDHENVILIYVLGVVFVAAQCGFKEAMLTCALSVIAYDHFFVPPQRSIIPSDPQLIYTFIVMIVAAIFLARLTSSLRRQAKLRGQQAELLNITNDAIFVWSLPDEKVAYWNSGAEQMFGILRDSAIGANTTELLKGLYSETRENLLQELKTKGEWSGEVTYHRADGAPVVVASRLRLRRGTDKTPTAVVEFATDISERKLADTRIREFYSVVSHELRTPLTAVYGSLRLIQSGSLQDDAAMTNDLVKISLLETQKVIHLVNDILDIQKIESGLLEIQRHPMQCAEVLSNTIKSLQVLADEAQVKLLFDKDTDVTINADYNRLLQVMTNLTANAIKFTPAGGRVELKLELDTPNSVRLSVQDSGCGIDEKQFPKLFQKFQQLDSTDSRQFGGSGLGLAISKSLVEQHGGKIGVQSAVGIGSTFWVKLPVDLDVDFQVACSDETRIRAENN